MKTYLHFICTVVLGVSLCFALRWGYKFQKENKRTNDYAMMLEHSHSMALSYLLDDSKKMGSDDRHILILMELIILSNVDARSDPKWNLEEKTYKGMVEILKKEDLSVYADWLIPRVLREDKREP